MFIFWVLVHISNDILEQKIQVFIINFFRDN